MKWVEQSVNRSLKCFWLVEKPRHYCLGNSIQSRGEKTPMRLNMNNRKHSEHSKPIDLNSKPLWGIRWKLLGRFDKNSPKMFSHLIRIHREPSSTFSSRCFHFRSHSKVVSALYLDHSFRIFFAFLARCSTFCLLDTTSTYEKQQFVHETAGLNKKYLLRCHEKGVAEQLNLTRKEFFHFCFGSQWAKWKFDSHLSWRAINVNHLVMNTIQITINLPRIIYYWICFQSRFRLAFFRFFRFITKLSDSGFRFSSICIFLASFRSSTSILPFFSQDDKASIFRIILLLHLDGSLSIYFSLWRSSQTLWP